MDMHDLSFKTGVRNIDVWKEQDRLAGVAPGDSCMTDDVSISQLRVCLEGGRAEKSRKKEDLSCPPRTYHFLDGDDELEKWGASPLRAPLLLPKLCPCNSCHIKSCTIYD